MKQNKKSSPWEKTRKFFNDIHLWIGLASGIFVFVICLSGTIYVYNSEIRELAAPHLFNVEPQGEKLSIEELTAIVKSESNANITSVSIPAEADKSYQIFVRSEGDKSRFGVGYYINPYTGALLGDSNEENATTKFMGYMFSLHRWLLLDKIEEPIFGDLPNRKLGSYISGTMTILFTIGLLTGIVIWFPKKVKRWREGLKIKFSGNWKRINHDLHNSLAFYSFIFLLIMGLTGPQWSFEWYREGLRKTLGTYEAPTAKGKSENKKEEKSSTNEAQTSQPITEFDYSSYIAAVNNEFPFEGDIRISLPSKGDDLVNINKYKAGFFAPAAADQLSLNAQNASVVEKTIFTDKSVNERISGSIKALHIGDVYGQFTKLLYFLACLVATSLPVTGTLIWINKMKKTKKRPVKSNQGKVLTHESI